MDQNNLVKLSSITKKICVALLGAFLLIFLLVHASANLCILRADEGTWYTDFCHFFGTNYVIKVFEVILMAAFLFHICLSLYLQVENRKARGTVRYHHASKTKTHSGSKLMMWTGILILAFLVMHLMQFWCVKLGMVDGKYMVKSEEVQKILQKTDNFEALQMPMQLAQEAVQSKTTPAQLIDDEIAKMKSEIAMMANDSTQSMMIPSYEEYVAQLESEKDNVVATASVLYGLMNGDKYTHNLTVEQKEVLVAMNHEFEEALEPDFYVMTREKFKIWWMDLIYIITFVVLWIHMRHAFQSAFQTLGLNNLKYGKAIDICAVLYATLICLMFTAVPVLVFLGF